MLGIYFSLKRFDMKKIAILIVMVLGLSCLSCTRWPVLYVGDSSGILTYDRINHKLEVIWENHSKYKSLNADSIGIDVKP